MYAVVSHESACDVIRSLFARAEKNPRATRFPQEAWRLSRGACVSGQRAFRVAHVAETLAGLGVATRPVDLLVPAKTPRSSGDEVRFHVWGGMVPQESLLQVADNLLVSGPELIIVQLCSAQGKLDALLDAHVAAVRAEAELVASVDKAAKPVIDHPLEWERIRRLVAATVVACEFAGTYRLGVGPGKAAYHAPRLMDARSLGRVVTEAGKSQGTRRARRVGELMLEGSASPMETALALMLTLPVDFGGFGLERPRLNRAVDVRGLREALSDRNAVTPDFLWAEQRVALEYDSAEFHEDRGKGQLNKDAIRANILTSAGYRVFRVTPQVAKSLPRLSLLARQLAHALDVELPEATPLQELRRHKLYMLLMPQKERFDCVPSARRGRKPGS